MKGEESVFYHPTLRKIAAAAVDLMIEFTAGFLGAYFGAMVAALMVVINSSSPETTQKSMMAGMVVGAVFWFFAASWVNRVFIQGVTRATFGKKLMRLEIVSTGDPINWSVMMRHWIMMTVGSQIKVVCTVEAPTAKVYDMQAVVGRMNITRISPVHEAEIEDTVNKSFEKDKKAA